MKGILMVIYGDLLSNSYSKWLQPDEVNVLRHIDLKAQNFFPPFLLMGSKWKVEI